MYNQAKKAIKKAGIGLILIGFFMFPSFVLAATVDLDSLSNENVKLLQVGNYTQGINWQNNSVNANPGDIVSFLVHYH
ncbi:hypothetical protein KKH46_01950, partial [Patescibacteria group bacterium]|nr:hypothetical protein [Patescibacteria group bacterium]MBU1956102.1 hypothetical protein [Patescibacteria group bacterium]